MNLRKILALVLVFAMCLSFVPTYAFAEDDGIYAVEEEEPIVEAIDEPEEEPAVEPVEEVTPDVPAEEETPAEEPAPVEDEPAEEPEEELTLTLGDEEKFEDPQYFRVGLDALRLHRRKARSIAVTRTEADRHPDADCETDGHPDTACSHRGDRPCRGGDL